MITSTHSLYHLWNCICPSQRSGSKSAATSQSSYCREWEFHVPPAPYRRQKKVVQRRTDDELRTSVYPSNLAPIATKLQQRAFQTICTFRFFDTENVFFAKISDFSFSVFALFSADFQGARFFLTSKSSCSRFFALDGQIFRSVQRSGLIL